MDLEKEIKILYHEYLTQKQDEFTEKKADKQVAYIKLVDTLSEEQQKLLYNYVVVFSEIWSDECFDAYRNGFQAGMRLLYNALQEK